MKFHSRALRSVPRGKIEKIEIQSAARRPDRILVALSFSC